MINNTVKKKPKMKSLLSLITALFLFFSPLAWADNADEKELKEAVNVLVKGDEKKFHDMLNSMMKRGNIDAKILYGAIKIKKSEFSEAIKILEPLAVNGNAKAQYYLGQAYSFLGDAKGEKWIQESAKQGYPAAVNVLSLNEHTLQTIDGKVKVDSLALMAQDIITKKLGTMPDKALACYKIPRAKLIASYRKAIGTCKIKIKAEVGETHPENDLQTIAYHFSQCSNNIVFKEAGITIQDLTNCFSQSDISS